MSASREKKQRQGSGPSERQVQAQQQTAAYQRKVRTYTIIGVVVVILVAALLIWNSGIFQRGQTAVTVGDTNYSVNDVSYYYQSARASTLSNYYYYYYFGMISSIPEDDDVMDETSGQTYREYFLEQAKESLTQLTALYDLAVENGYTEADVSTVVQRQIDSTKASASSGGYTYGSYLKAQYGRYMTASAYKSILTRAAVANAYYYDYYYDLSYSDEEIQAYYDENKNTLDTFEYSYLYFKPEEVATTDEDGNDLELTDEEIEALEAEALAAAKDKAAHALDQLNDGTSVADLAEEYELTTSAYGDHVSNTGSSVSSGYNEELFGYADGQTGIVENGESGYYVVALHARTRAEDPTVNIRHILISAETTTDESGNTVAPTDEAWAAAKAEAEKILAEYQSGEQTEAAFAALATEYSADSSYLYGGLYQGGYGFVTEFSDWAFDSSRQNGDVGLVQHVAGEDDSNAYYGYHIIYYIGENTPAWTQTCISALRSAESSEWLEELQSGYTSALTSGAEYVAK